MGPLPPLSTPVLQKQLKTEDRLAEALAKRITELESQLAEAKKTATPNL